jgi:hypothetical protein
MSSQASINSGRQGSGLKRSRDDEAMPPPPPKRIARAVDSGLTMPIENMSTSRTWNTLPPSERIANTVDFDVTNVSASTSQTRPLFMGGLPIYKAPSDTELPFRPHPQRLDIHLSSAPLTSDVPI